jgi:Tfp pilus assembly protein PilX
MMRRPCAPRTTGREAGILLLTVALLLAVMAALAFTMNRAAGMDVQTVAADYDRRNAGYLAEAAVAAAKWKNQLSKCGAAAVALPQTAFAGATLSTTSVQIKGKTITITGQATVSATGASDTLTRALQLLDLTTKEEKDLGGGPRDTYVASTLTQQDKANSLVVSAGSSNALLFWAMTDVPPAKTIVSAQMTLTLSSGSATPRTVNVYPVATAWDPSATWTQARPGIAWRSGGGDYITMATLVGVSVAAAGAYAWDVTGMTDDWVSGRLVDNGLLLRMPVTGQSANFASLEGSPKPVLHVKYVKQC